MDLPLSEIVQDFGNALKSVDSQGPVNKNYKPGVGPLTEAQTINLALKQLKSAKPDQYKRAQPRRYPSGGRRCDLVIPDLWAIEFKLIRPFGDNGEVAERWSENILYPYPGSVSSIGDCMKLLKSGFPERLGIIVFGYEHSPPKIPLEPAVRSFELITTEVCQIRLGQRHSCKILGLIHPHHQQARVCGWEVKK